MRQLISSLFISLDGVVESPDQWSFDHFDNDMLELMTSILATLDGALMGRNTYNEWAPYWPTSSDEPFASFINNVQKYVVSSTLDKLEWQNSTLIKGDIVKEISKLKQQESGVICTQGSPSLVQLLIENDLLDTLYLQYYPVVAGKGKRLFEDGNMVKRFQLVDSKITSTGVAMMKYQLRK